MIFSASHPNVEPLSFTKRVLLQGFLSLILFLSGFLIWLTPLPVLFAYKKYGRKAGLLGVGFVFLVLLLLYQVILPFFADSTGDSGVSQALLWFPGMGHEGESSGYPFRFALSYYSFYAAVGIMLGEWGDRIKSVTRLTGRTLLYLCVGLFLLLFLQIKGSFGELIAGTENFFLTLINQMNSSSPINSEAREQLIFLQDYKETIVYYAVRLMPAMIVCTAIFVIWLNILVGKKLFVKEAFFRALGPLSQWRVPFLFVWVLIGMALLLFVNIYLLHTELFKFVALNAFIIFGLIYFFEGLAILAFFSQRWLVSPLIKIVFYILFLIFFQPIGILILVFGFFDSWFNFRKFSLKAKQT